MRFSINDNTQAEVLAGDADIPSYLVAADLHNLGNGNESFLDKAENLVTGAGKFVAASLASLVSGANQLYNIAPSIGNALGGSFELSDTAQVMENLDSDLGQYYRDNQQAIDVAGFMLSSFVPGLAGTKVLNAGQLALKTAVETGKIGGNLGTAVGLLTPSQPKLLAEAVRAAVSPNATLAVWNPNTLKAVAGSISQATLEGMAFTTAAEVIMFNSPVLDNHDVADIASNIMWGGIVSGAIGGIFGAASTAHAIYKTARGVDEASMPFAQRALLADSAPSSSKILTYLEDAKTTPLPPAEGEYVSKFASIRESKLRGIDTDVRSEFLKLSGNDKSLAGMWYNWHKLASTDAVEGTLFATTSSGRLSSKLAEETEISKLLAKSASLTEEEIARLKNLRVQYIKNHGEGAFTITAEAPKVFGIADTLAKGDDYATAVSRYKQTIKQVWNPAETDALTAEARYVTAMKSPLASGQKIAFNDIPYLTAAYERGVVDIQVSLSGDQVISFSTAEALKAFILKQKENIALGLAQTGKKSSAEIAKIVDSTEAWLNGQRLADDVNAFALRHSSRQYTELLKSKELIKADAADIATWELPSYTKYVKDTGVIEGVDANVVQGMTAITQSQKLYAQQAGVVADSILGADNTFIPITQSDILKANRASTGGGLISFQNENYGTLGSKAQYTGAHTIKAMNARVANFEEASNSLLYQLGNNQEAAIEFSVLNNRLRSIPETYILNDEGTALVLAKVADYQAAVKGGATNVKAPSIAADIPTTIPIKNAETLELVKFHIETNGARTEALSSIRTQQGVKFQRDARSFYPIPANPTDYKFYAFVIDDSITGSFGRSKMIHAKDAADLEAKMTVVKQADPSLRVLTGKDAESYYKSLGQFEYERTLTDVSFDAALKRKGVSADYLAATDPQKIVSEFKDWHVARERNLVREAVLLKYEPQVNTLLKLGDDSTKISRSHYTAMDALSYVENTTKNPYNDYVKTMLGISTAKEYPFWNPVNEVLDRKVSALYNKVYDTFRVAKGEEDLVQINSLLQQYGYQGAAYDALTDVLANSKADKGVLTNFVRKANALLGTVIVRLDPISALNNVIGSNVLLGAEVKSVVRAIQNGGDDAVGDLAKLANIKVPGAGDEILSPGKLIANSMRRFHSEEGKALREVYKQRGFITEISDQYMETISGLAPRITDSAAELNGKVTSTFNKLQAFAKKGEALTGNRVAEEFNRFVAADVMKQITDVAVKHGVLEEEAAWAYINTFVNRTQGNFLAAQRPGMFSGPIGQAIGLFQTYQFNFLQQLLRHIGNGEAKDVATLLGLQGAIYGMNGLPAFNAINTHIVGTASGNKDHRDMYDFVYGVAGKEAGNWLMYGAGSNVWGLLSKDLSMNLYTRGDINPRQLTIVPTNPADVPIVKASANLFSSLKNAWSNIENGGNVWKSVLQGIEHSGLNRPLAGLAQTLEAADNPYSRVYSTSSKGNVIGSNDLWTLATLTRLSGAKPLDEAIAIDRAFNIDVYRAKDVAARQSLGEAIKTTVIAGGQPTAEQVNNFAKEYAALGGKQTEFNQFFMQQYTAANTSQANKLKEHLASPLAQSLQRVMRGYDLRDFSH